MNCTDMNFYLAGRCFYCGVHTKKMNLRPGRRMPKHARTKDHIIPYSQGGRGDTVKVTCCRGCNDDKADLTLEEYRAKRSAERGSQVVVVFFGETLAGEENPFVHSMKLPEKIIVANRPLCKQCNKKQAVNDLGFCSKRCRSLFERKAPAQPDPDTEPDWSGKCENCGASPIVPCTGLCGPCSFGEAETAGGNW